MTEKRKRLTPPGDQAFRASSPVGRSLENCFSGTVSFLRRQLSRDLANVDIAVTGIPFDLATTGRSGARLGPRALRAASLELATTLPFPGGVDPFKLLSIVDYGDCHLSFDIPQVLVQQIQEHIEAIISQNVMPISMGGDHFVSYPIIKALYQKHGTLNLIHFDAHPDTWEDTTLPGQNIPDEHVFLNHGSMFRRATLEHMIDPSHSVQIGIRTFVEDTMGFKHISPDDVNTQGLDAIIQTIKERVDNNAPTYLTFDIDCLDPAFAPGTGTPVCGGMSTREVLYIIRALHDINFVGMDLVEVAPAYDNSEITALAGAHIIHDFICLIAQKKLG